jgi:hypothetical protein
MDDESVPHTLTADETPIEKPSWAEKFVPVIPVAAGTTSPVKFEFVPLMVCPVSIF